MMNEKTQLTETTAKKVTWLQQDTYKFIWGNFPITCEI